MQDLAGIEIHCLGSFGQLDGFENILQSVEDFVQGFLGYIQSRFKTDIL